MKVTLTPEPQTFALKIGALTLVGLRADGELGPVRKLVDDKNRVLLLWDSRSDFSKAFTTGIFFLINPDVECEVMGGTPSLIGEISEAILRAEVPA